MSRLRTGDRVTHPEFGAGRVMRRRFGWRVLVAFDVAPSMPRTVSASTLTRELAVAESAAGGALGDVQGVSEIPAKTRGTDTQVQALTSSVPDDPGASHPPAEDQLEQPECFQILEALRLGVVPRHGVAAYTVGRDRELRSLKAMLKTGRGCRIAWGDYGTGKTHMLDVAEQEARRQGFATARVILDPAEMSVAHPARLYRAIAESYTWPDGGGEGLDPLMDCLVDSPAHTEPDGEQFSRFFSSYLHVLNSGDEDWIGWFRDYVLAYPVDGAVLDRILRRSGWQGKRPLTLSDYRTYGRMYMHLIGTLASWTQHAGARGLVLLFDEVERLEAVSAADRGYAMEVLRHFAAVTMKREDLLFDPEEDLYRGGHPVHRNLSLEFRPGQPLSAVFALTPLPEIRASFRAMTESEDYDLPLGPPTRRDLPQLVDRIARIYTVAYRGYPAAIHEDELVRACEEIMDDGAAGFRSLVRTAVLMLDERRLSGGV